MTKIAIVGADESRWTKEQKVKVKFWIKCILIDAKHNLDNEMKDEYIVLVSGHCPKYGVDIWAEEEADKLGIKKEIYPAEVNQWEDLNAPLDWSSWIVKKGYRSRNIQIAEACDILYCIVPKREKGYCYHCKVYGHPATGSCWVVKYCKEHFPNKETHLIVM